MNFSSALFLWFILRFLHLRPFPWMLYCGSFCDFFICDHFRGCFLVVHSAISSFATTSVDAFLWFILRFLHLRSLPRLLSCGSFCDFFICGHFRGCFLVVHSAISLFATTSLVAFLWFISRFLHLRSLPRMLFCGSFCVFFICGHFRGCFLVVHSAISSFATTSVEAFLWFILRFLHLRSLLWMLSCGSFCDSFICDHFRGCFFVVHSAISSFATTSVEAANISNFLGPFVSRWAGFPAQISVPRLTRLAFSAFSLANNPDLRHILRPGG